MKKIITTSIFIWLFCYGISGANAAPKVVATIAPIHSLVTAVMEGAGAPTLLLRANTSPHSYQLRPSDARSLSSADVIFWVGPELEMFLSSPLNNLAPNANKVALVNTPNLKLLPARTGGVWSHDEKHSDEHDVHDAHNHLIDPHIWLSPNNARHIVSYVAQVLAETDPEHAELFKTNAQKLSEKLSALNDYGHNRIGSLTKIPFLVFHDGFRYFEDAFQLNAVGAIVTHPSRRPSGQRIKQLRTKISDSGVHCALHEPQFSSDILNVVIEDHNVRLGRIDPIGIDFAPGPTLYVELMRQNIDAIAACLESSG